MGPDQWIKTSGIAFFGTNKILNQIEDKFQEKNYEMVKNMTENSARQTLADEQNTELSFVGQCEALETDFLSLSESCNSLDAVDKLWDDKSTSVDSFDSLSAFSTATLEISSLSSNSKNEKVFRLV